MGMIDAFNDNADFLKMIKNNNNVHKVKIDCFIHKTFIKVDEGNTEAEAVSKIKMEFQPKIAIPKKKEKKNNNYECKSSFFVYYKRFFFTFWT